ncbi:hypothetical protein ZHAS_00007078 [Anopheles sinensis]|uniref:Uncharacterized protein n=1 Tax=Anopheles sinensis TaxID=74873 RepID=A0A084VNT2_ANOSI|nr:hypothetical protein ZHAS_00007078 [Anopheles sinensis]
MSHKCHLQYSSSLAVHFRIAETLRQRCSSSPSIIITPSIAPPFAPSSLGRFRKSQTSQLIRGTVWKHRPHNVLVDANRNYLRKHKILTLDQKSLPRTLSARHCLQATASNYSLQQRGNGKTADSKQTSNLRHLLPLASASALYPVVLPEIAVPFVLPVPNIMSLPVRSSGPQASDAGKLFR